MNALEAKLAQMRLSTPPPVPVVYSTEPPAPGDISTYSPEVYPEKHDTRRDTLNLLRDPTTPSRLWYKGHLTCDLAELCGDAPDASCGFLLEENALTPDAKFIGMNKDQGIIDRNAKAFAFAADRTRWIRGYAQNLVLDLDNPVLKNVGVFVFDGSNSPSNMNLEDILSPILAFAKAQYMRLGQFLLVINQTLRGAPGAPLDAGCQQYEAILRKYCGMKTIPESAYTIYTNTDRVARMRILRLTYGW